MYRPQFPFPKSERRLSPILSLVAIALICVAVIPVSIWTFGFPDGGYDLPQHLRFAISFHRSLTTDLSIPAWGDDNIGFGSVGVRFYPPIGSISAAVGFILLGDWQSAMTLTMTFWMFVGCIGVYLFCREWVDPKHAMVGGLAFAVVPYHLLQVFQYFLFAEFIALSILPYCFLFLSRMAHRPGWVDAALFGASYSLLTLTHIPVGLIAALIFPLFLLPLIDWRLWKDVLVKLALSSFVWSVLSIFHWLKVIREREWLAHLDPKFASGVYSFQDWLFPNYLVPRRFMENTVKSAVLDVSIVLTVLFLIPGVIVMFASMKKGFSSERRILMALSAAAAVSVFMLTRPSVWLWETLPLLGNIQFPWRFMTLVSFFGVASFAIALPALASLGKRYVRPAVYFGVAVLLLVALLDSTQIIAMIVPSTKAEFGAKLGSLPTDTITEPWWPVWAKRGAFENTEKLTSTGREIELNDWRDTERSFTVAAGQPQDVRVATFFYPYWKATVNGSDVEVGKDQNGVIVIPIPAEAASVQVRFREPWYYAAANWSSLAGWLLLIGFGLFRVSRRFLPLRERGWAGGASMSPQPAD